MTKDTENRLFKQDIILATYSGFPTRPDSNRTVQQQMTVIDLKFRILAVEEMPYLYSENKGADSLGVTAKLFCVFAKTVHLIAWLIYSRASSGEGPVLFRRVVSLKVICEQVKFSNCDFCKSFHDYKWTYT